MTLLKLFRGTQAELNERPVSDGALLFATDTKAVYIDQGSQRIEVASVQDLGDYITQTQLTGALAAEMSEREKQDGLLEDAIADKAPLNHTHANATTSADGFMSSEDKTKLNGIATGANKYTLPAATSSTLGGVKTGSNITNSSGTISLTKTNVTNALGYTPPTADKDTTYSLSKSGSTIKLTGSDGTETTVTDSNTTYTLGSFGITATAAEINKLDGLATTKTELGYLDGVTSNVQTQLNGKAASSHNHSASNITSGTLAVARGGTGVTANPSMLVNLGSGSAASVFATSPRPGVTGTLPVSKGGTGATTAAQARENLGIAAADDIIAIQSEEPTSSACKLWIQI